VDRLDPKTRRIRHFSGANGLAHGEIRSAVADRSGALWFATTQGLSRLEPSIERSTARPRVLITELSVGGTRYPVSQLGESSIAKLELTPSRNQLQVEFVGLDHEAGDSLRYTYRLERADQTWCAPREQHSVNYAALAPGTYRFEVKAVTPEGAESRTPAEIDFTVLPPFWRRWWFELAAAALAGALGTKARNSSTKLAKPVTL